MVIGDDIDDYDDGYDDDDNDDDYVGVMIMTQKDKTPNFEQWLHCYLDSDDDDAVGGNDEYAHLNITTLRGHWVRTFNLFKESHHYLLRKNHNKSTYIIMS